MKRVMKLFMPIGLAILLAACSSKQSENKDLLHENDPVATKHERGKDFHNHPEEQEPRSSTAKGTSVVITDDKLNAIYPSYVDLTKALTDGDVAGAKVAANTIMVGAKELNGGTVLANQAAKITKASDIERQREAYSDLSTHIIALVKQSGLQAGELYVSYCSMKNSSWLSNSKQIKNPYYGASMLTCGETKEIIQ